MKRTILFAFVILTISAQAQKKIKTLEISDSIVSVTVDRPGDFYVLTKEGQFQKFDGNGNLLILFKNDVAPTLFDPHDGSRLFAYFRDKQYYAYLNPSFEVTQGYAIDSAFVIQPWLMCPSGDQKVWVLDAADHSLKKLNVSKQVVEIEVEIDLNFFEQVQNVSWMRDYQGFVFLLSPKHGLYVFNSMGKHIRTIEVKGIHSFNFLGEELYYHEGNKLKFFDLFTAETRAVDFTGKKGDVVLGDQRLFLVHPTHIEIFEFTP